MFVKIKMNILWSAGCSKELIIRLKKSEQKCIGTTGRITGKTKNAFREINNRKVKSLRKALDFLNYYLECCIMQRFGNLKKNCIVKLRRYESPISCRTNGRILKYSLY